MPALPGGQGVDSGVVLPGYKPCLHRWGRASASSPHLEVRVTVLPQALLGVSATKAEDGGPSGEYKAGITSLSSLSPTAFSCVLLRHFPLLLLCLLPKCLGEYNKLLGEYNKLPGMGGIEPPVIA